MLQSPPKTSRRRDAADGVLTQLCATRATRMIRDTGVYGGHTEQQRLPGGSNPTV